MRDRGTRVPMHGHIHDTRSLQRTNAGIEYQWQTTPVPISLHVPVGVHVYVHVCTRVPVSENFTLFL